MSAFQFPRILTVLAAVLLAAGSALAAVRTYPTDSSTLHLWHLDEAAVPAADVGIAPLTLGALGGGPAGVSLGNVAFTGFGNALSTFDGGPNVAVGSGTDGYLAPLALADTNSDNISMELVDATTGAFTFEALIRLDFSPTANLSTRNAPMQIVSGEQDAAGGVRVFQFRFDPVGLNPNADGFTTALTAPALEFISVRGGQGVENKILLLPTSGPDAPVQGGWYHAAVAYSGAAGAANNLVFYWTRLDAARTQAVVLGSKTLANDLSAGEIDFAIGNTGRGFSQNNFVGLIDEVRISRVARAATDFVFFADTDNDQMSDAWETLYFSSLSQPAEGPQGDFDSDGFTNLAEFRGGSRPNDPAATPDNLDGDGLPDVWERQYFGGLAQTGTGDPDGDGFTNAQEFSAGTQPNNALSRPDDTDMDGLPDPWETSFFGNLAQTGASDPDGDGASNAAEYGAGSLPTNGESLPPKALAVFAPVQDGDAGTSEFGFAGNSNINATAFICSALQTVGNRQFMAYYGRHQTSAAYAFNNRIWIARRVVGAAQWEVFRTNFTANDINDGHDVISFALDGEGVMHMSWGMHNDAFHYAKTTGPVTGGQPIVFGPDAGTMTGNETVVTYPQFLTLPNGDVLYFFRKGNPATGGSGSGDNALNRYSLATHTWTNVHASGSTQLPFIKGTGWNPDYNAYFNMPCMDAAGNIFLTWTWRYTPDYQTNQDMAFAKSANGGVSWQRSNGSTYSLPISKLAESGVENTRAQQILALPQQSSLINQAGMCLDDQGQPIIATWWAPGTPSGDFRRQYMIVYPGSGATWETRQVSNRTIDAPGVKKDAGAARDLGRPVVVCDRDGRILVIYRDNDRTNGLTVVHSLPRVQDPNRVVWTQLELTTDNLGNFEPVIDLARWRRDGVLHALYQPSAGLGYTPPANNASPIGVMEWDAAAYFRPRPLLHRAFINRRADIALAFESQLGWDYRIWTSPDLLNWTALTKLAGTGGILRYTHLGGGGTKRFWRLELQEGGLPP